MGTLKQGKISVRKKILTLLRNQKEEDRLRKSMVILDKVFACPEFQNSKTILFYASLAEEVETFEMMRRAQKLGKRIALPTLLLAEKMIVPVLVDNLEEDLENGPYGIKQPSLRKAKALSADTLDLLLVPGIAFDKNNNRLGRGAGYYDRFLKEIPRDIPSIGLAFDFQVVRRLPHQTHDIPVSRVITN